jgi:voltage-gated potassium channel
VTPERHGGRSRQREGQGVERLLRRKYLILLTALLLLLVAYPVLRESIEGRVLLDALLTTLFLAAFVVVFTTRRHRIAALVLGVPTLTGLWTGYALPDVPRTIARLDFHLVGSAFLILCVTVILREIYRAGRVSVDEVCGALCGYLLIGLIFGHLYCVVEELSPGSFRAGGAVLTEPADTGGRHFLLTYFSLVTLTTLGYGDVVPMSSAARGLVVVEAVVGQFYLAVLIAELVGKRLSQPPTDDKPP